MKKKFYKSQTTQNVAGGTVAGAGSAGIAGMILAGVRKMFPDLIPWDATMDNNVAITMGMVLIPLLSRVIAAFRQKKGDAGSGVVRAGIVLLCASLGLAGMAGCVTTKTPDGLEVTQVDVAAIQQILDASDDVLEIATEIINLCTDIQTARLELSGAESAIDAAEAQAVLDALTEALLSLQTAKTKAVP